MNIEKNKSFINEVWDSSIIPTLMEYIKIPNKSPAFDKNWKQNGHMDQAVKLISEWCMQQNVENLKLEVISHENRTPLIFMEIPGSTDETILLYGHLDKQPEMSGWDSDLDPWKPVMKGDKLYGRGGADDGYAAFASLTAIKSLQQQQIPHARCIILIEASEESGSSDLPFYINALENRIGKPSLVICLDSGCGNYDQLWMTTSLRGLISGALHIEVLKQGVHSGYGSGVAPSCFAILRQLLNRIENENSGIITLKDLFVDIPTGRLEQAKHAADILGEKIYQSVPFKENVHPLNKNLKELVLNRTWRPSLTITGLNGLPKLENAGNVTTPALSIKLSLRVPPTLDVDNGGAILKDVLEKNPPFNAKIKFDIIETSGGWNAPAESAWLTEISQTSSKNYFGREAVYIGEGGTIPFMGMLGKKFPKAQFLITGVLGPQSNAHGPNEFLHIPTGKKLTCCVSEVIARHYTSSN